MLAPGRREKCFAHLREGVGRELQFLLQQCTQHLVLSLQIKHPLLQLDTLLPQVLSTQEAQEAQEGQERNSEMSRLPHPSQLYPQLQPLGMRSLGILS